MSRALLAAFLTAALFAGSPGLARAADPSPSPQTAPAAGATGATADELAQLRAQMEILARRLDALTRANAQAATATAASTTPEATRAATATNAVITTVAPAPTEAPIVKKPPVDRSIDDIYKQQNALFSRRLTLTPSFTQAYSDSRYFSLNGFLALGAVFLGNANVAEQRSNVSIFNLNALYGLNDRIQLEANVPYYSRDSAFTSVGALDSTDVPSEARTGSSGLGDVSVGAYYALRHETPDAPSVVLNGHVSLPTGQRPYGIKLLQAGNNTNLQFPATLPTGQGTFGYEAGISLVKTLDPAIVFGGFNYYFNQGARMRDLSNEPGVVQPGNAFPGNAFMFSLGTAFALNERTSLSFTFQDTMSDPTRIQPDGQPIAAVVGSATNAAMLTIGTSYASNSRQSIVTELGIGMTKDAPNFQFGIRFPRRF